MPTPQTSQLKLWRKTQLQFDDELGAQRPMSIAEAAAELGVPYQTWYGWERNDTGPREERLVIALYRMSRGQLRPDHFYPLPDLRAEARLRIAESDPPVDDPNLCLEDSTKTDEQATTNRAAPPQSHAA